MKLHIESILVTLALCLVAHLSGFSPQEVALAYILFYELRLKREERTALPPPR